MTVDEQDRHLLAVAAVWAVVGVVGLLGGAVMLGLCVRVFLWIVAG